MEKEIEFAKRIGYKYVSITPSGKISGYGICRKTAVINADRVALTLKKMQCSFRPVCVYLMLAVRFYEN